MKKFVYGLVAGVVIMMFGTCCAPQTHIIEKTIEINHNFPQYSIEAPKYTIENELYKSVVQIITTTPAGNHKRGTGFAISKDRIMTAGHICIDDIHNPNDMKFEIKYINAEGKKVSRKGGKFDIGKAENPIDLCVVTFKNHGLKPLPIVKSFEDIGVHDVVFMAGGPAGYFPVTKKGRVVEVKREDWDGFLVVDIAVTGGVSGAPVVDTQGRFIGIVVEKRTNYDHIAACVPADLIKNWLKTQYGK